MGGAQGDTLTPYLFQRQTMNKIISSALIRDILKAYPCAVVGVSENTSAKQILLRCASTLQIDDILQQWCNNNNATVVDDAAVRVQGARKKEMMREFTINY